MHINDVETSAQSKLGPYLWSCKENIYLYIRSHFTIGKAANFRISAFRKKTKRVSSCHTTQYVSVVECVARWFYLSNVPTNNATRIFYAFCHWLHIKMTSAKCD
jgi:hypothetical protein